MQQDAPSGDIPVLRLAGEGESVELSSTCLLVFLDETGDDSLSDPHYPLFGIGGCVVPAGLYERFVDIPWRYMMGKWFGGPDQIFHSTDYSGGRGTSDQYEALTHYFTNFHIGRIASVITRLAFREIDVETYQLIAESLFNRLRKVAAAFEFTEIVIIVESSSKYDQFADQYLFAGRESLTVILGEIEHQIRLRKFLIPKSAGACGLQVADAIVNAAGGQARARWRGATKPNRDFMAVFGDGVDSR